MKRFLSSWSVRIGLVLLIAFLLFLPWRQEFLWQVGEDNLVPIRAVRYRFLWDPPWNSSLDVARLAAELLILALLVVLAYRYETGGRPKREPPPAAEGPYGEADWRREMERQGGDVPPARCPACGLIGFYGPREDETGRYRQCRFCGFHQRVDGEKQQLRACVHHCGQVRDVAGSPWITWVAPDTKTYVCESCGEEADVSASTVDRPVDDPYHPWWKVPQEATHGEYIRYWLANGAPGRSYL